MSTLLGSEVDKSSDFLGTLLLKFDNPEKQTSKNGQADDKTVSSLIKDALITLIFAGRDNNQSSLNWSLYEMCRDPERRWEARLVDEARKNKVVAAKYGDTKVISSCLRLSIRSALKGG